MQDTRKEKQLYRSKKYLLKTNIDTQLYKNIEQGQDKNKKDLRNILKGKIGSCLLNSIR